MPELSRFYGLIIKMFFGESEHGKPHIHVIYGEYIGMIDIDSGRMLEGDLPNKALGLVREWIADHRYDLFDIWNTQEFRKLPPLK